MANTLITPSVIAREALRILENELVFGGQVHTEYKKEFVKVGDTVSIRKPVQFVVHDGADITGEIQDVVEGTTSIVIDKEKNIPWNFSSKDLTLTVEDYTERYIRPAAIQLANQIDFDISALYKQIYNATGTAGTTPSTFIELGNSMKKLDKLGVPKPRNICLDPDATWAMADALKGIFNEKIAKDIIMNGRLGRIAGMDLFTTQNIHDHTAGTLSGTPVIDTVSSVTYITTSVQANTSTVHTDGYTGTVLEGDIFTISTVNSVNPRTKQSTGELQQFTVTADVVADTNTPLVVSPAIVTTGAYQNVDAAPVAEDTVTFLADHTANLSFHRNALALVMVPMEIPDGVKFSHRISTNQYSIRVVKAFDILTNAEIIRLDVLYGVKAIYPILACRTLG